MIKLGLTGGIGSGKSTVCQIFSHLGVHVYNADERSKWLVNHHPSLRRDIIEAFGEASFEDEVYNRAYISSIVFKDQEKLQKLNAIIHPIVLKDWDEFCSGYQFSPYVVKESAIILEAGGRKTIDKIALVFSPLELRIKRVMERDMLSREAVETRIKSQMPEEEKMKLSDYIIYNDETHSLIEQVQNLHQTLFAIHQAL